MKRHSVAVVLFACLFVPAQATAQKAVLVLANSGSPGATDQSIIDHLEQDLGLETVLIDQTVNGPTKNDLLDNEEPDVIILLESVSSGNVAGQLNDREEPIIVQEAYVYDDMKFVTGTAGCTDCWGDLGNDFGNQSNVSDIDIVSDDHPIIQLAGLEGADTIAVYDIPGRIQWIRNFIDEVEVLAVGSGGFDEDGDGLIDEAAAFVIEPGAVLVDGSRLAGLRIGGWAHTEGGDWSNASPEGRDLWDAMLDYALDSTGAVPGGCREAPATATRAIVPPRPADQATCRGDFKDGDVISVEVEVADLREANGDCTVPDSIEVTEEPPAGWAVSDVSHGGTVAGGVITWTLSAADLSTARTLTYSVAAAAPGNQQESFSFQGGLVELDAGGDPVDAGPFGIAGDVSLLSDPEECAPKAALVLQAAGNPGGTDQSIINHLEQDLGMETVLIDQNVDGPTKNAILDSERPDVIILLESVSSGNVTSQLNDREEPVLIQEAFVYDDMKFVSGTAGCTDCWGDLGNDFGNQSNVSDIDIVADDHPIIQAAGLDGAGTIAVYDFPGRIQWIRNFIADIEVLAVGSGGLDEDGDGLIDEAAAFVVEPGAVLVDGSRLAGLRIGGWAHTEGGDWSNASPEGRDLWDAMLNYALDSTEPVPGVCVEPPATAARAIERTLPPDDASCAGEFKDGDVVPVAIEVGDLRVSGGDCAVPEAVQITEEPPTGWAVSDVSDGGTVAGGVITWTLTAAELQATRTLTYRATAAAPGMQQRFTFRGELVELDAGDPVDAGPFSVAGDVSLLSEPEVCPGTAVIILANPGSPPAGDQAIIDRLGQKFGMKTVLLDDNDAEATKIAAIDAEQPSVIFVLESVSSGNVGTQLNNRPEPVIFHEPFLYDDMGFVLGTSGCDLCWGDLGNDFGNMSGESDLDVVSDHPIIRAAGLQDGDTFAAFDTPARVLWGRNLIDDAEVLAVHTNGYDEDGDGLSEDAALIVVEEGADLLDGTESAGLRIGGWIHAEGDGFNLLSEEGLALWDACVLYALGAIDETPVEPRFVRGDADSDGSVNLTDGVAILGWLFGGSDEPACLDAADANDDGDVIISDTILILGWLFSGGLPLAPPAPVDVDYAPESCGIDVGEDTLGCLSPSPKCSG